MLNVFSMTPDLIGISVVVDVALRICVHGVSHLAVLVSELAVSVQFTIHDARLDWN